MERESEKKKRRRKDREKEEEEGEISLLSAVISQISDEFVTKASRIRPEITQETSVGKTKIDSIRS